MAWYVVFKGNTPGIYNTWHDCSEQVLGYKGVVHRKYSSYEHALHDFNLATNSKPVSNTCATFAAKQMDGTV